MYADNIAMYQDTVNIVNRGFYTLNGREVTLPHSRDQLSEARVFLPDELKNVCLEMSGSGFWNQWDCGFRCTNVDSFVSARRLYREDGFRTDSPDQRVLILNMASPVHPGGGVRRGAHAQEEDLCRKSSLLLSLESREAASYYEYNKSLHTYMGSDAVIISPTVDIIRDENGELLPEPVTAAVITCAAPMLNGPVGMEGLSEQEYRQMFSERIFRMLCCAAYRRYDTLILSAWGCGAFANDARTVSDLFYEVFRSRRINGARVSSMFRTVEFAIQTRSPEGYNYREFKRNFDPFCLKDENIPRP